MSFDQVLFVLDLPLFDALPIHDVHHIPTGYDTSLVGEGQVSAWELGSGRDALGLEMGYVYLGALTGLLLNRKKTVAAFVRGLKARNFFGRKLDRDMLDKTLGELRKELALA